MFSRRTPPKPNWRGLIAHVFVGKRMRDFHMQDMIGSVALKVINTLLVLSLAILLARMLGPEGYGIYAFAYGLISLIAIPAQIGLPTLVVREVARYRLKEQWGLISGLLRRSNQAVLGLGTLLLGSTVLTMSYFFENISKVMLETLLWALLLVPLVALGKLRGAALRGLHKVVQGQLPEMIVIPALFLLFISATVAFGNLTPPVAMALHGLAAGLGFGSGVLMLVRAIPEPVYAARPIYETRIWLKSILPLSLISGMQVINSQAAIILLGIFSTPTDVGLYRVAVQGANIVSISLIAINAAIAPRISEHFYAADTIRLQKLVTLSGRWILAASLPIAVTLIVFGGAILNLVFGTEFESAHIALVILCIGQSVNATIGSVVFLLNMTGHEKDTAKGLIVAAISNIVLGVLLIPPFGIAGAAVATAVSLAWWNILLYRQVRRRIGIISLPFELTSMKRLFERLK